MLIAYGFILSVCKLPIHKQNTSPCMNAPCSINTENQAVTAWLQRPRSSTKTKERSLARTCSSEGELSACSGARESGAPRGAAARPRRGRQAPAAAPQSQGTGRASSQGSGPPGGLGLGPPRSWGLLSTRPLAASQCAAAHSWTPASDHSLIVML